MLEGVPPEAWRSPEEIVRAGFGGARVLMANEAHDGLRRCVRTREVGRRMVAAADALGVRHLAMEAFQPGFAEAANASRRVPEAPGGYLAQGDMRALIQAALDLGWTLWPYEASPDDAPAELRGQFMTLAYTNWREEEQARRLIGVLDALGPEERLLVWCGNGHATKVAVVMGDEQWVPLGVQLTQLFGAEPFVVDQTLTVRFPPPAPPRDAMVEEARPQLERFGGTAGLLRAEAPADAPFFHGVDAALFSLDNEMS